ncbi:DapH/DapD/GlmU-related protein [Desulfovibrio desulfuricans]|uniref:acyltransferase n=1 Tax=Desulfovibrio desulfuricans TaxID=876 RepID=UPI0035B0EE22
MNVYRIVRKIYNIIFRISRLDVYKKMGLVVGENFNMQGEVFIDESHIWHIEIGDSVTLAPRVQIFAHDASTKMHLDYTRIGKIKIGSRVFIGASSIILPGVTIGDDVIIGANSVVSRDIPSGNVAAGAPAKIICSTENYLSRKRSEMQRTPCFGDEYTGRNNVTPAMKNEMNAKMDKIGYIK